MLVWGNQHSPSNYKSTLTVCLQVLANALEVFAASNRGASGPDPPFETHMVPIQSDIVVAHITLYRCILIFIFFIFPIYDIITSDVPSTRGFFPKSRPPKVWNQGLRTSGLTEHHSKLPYLGVSPSEHVFWTFYPGFGPHMFGGEVFPNKAKPMQQEVVIGCEPGGVLRPS